ncbi:MAG: transporter substrate-binding domain-containing protein [Cyclobacteriaceae bacterium]|nr:transporter substrate-binding domain-containing protein [Cyclobacteriaceae bacterium]
MLVLLSVLMITCKSGQDSSDLSDSKSEYFQLSDPIEFDLDRIQQRGVLRAIVDNNTTSYFIYRGTPKGFEYDLLRWLAASLDLELEIIIEPSIEGAFEMLNRGEGDIIAHNLTITKSRRDHIEFSIPHTQTRQVLVQRKPEGWQNLTTRQLDDELIREPSDLIGKEIMVKHSSSFHNRLKNLSEELGEDIISVEAGREVEVESMIRMVSEGEIEYTVADEYLARVNAVYYDNIDVSTAISLNQSIAWGIRKNAPELKEAVDEWLAKHKKTTRFAATYRKYFEDSHALNQRATSVFSSVAGGVISPYDDYIMKAADRIGWDWRLLASLIYQESRFNPEARSWAGASGLMQLMPRTAQRFGVTDPMNPYQSINAGTNFIAWLERYWSDKVPDKQERLKFILASYNAGQGHVLDAVRLAEKHGARTDRWDDHVEVYLLKKSEAQYYRDPVVRHGYVRGWEPVKYVKEIMARYKQYRDLVV